MPPHPPDPSELEAQIAAMRRFSRFYTRLVGVLQEGLLESPFSLAEVRVLYELAHRERATAAEIAADLDLDPGYLSRMLRTFSQKGLISRAASRDDARQRPVALSARGRAAFAKLDARSHDEIGALLSRIPTDQRRRLVGSMETIESLVAPTAQAARAPSGAAATTSPAVYVVRDPHPGDLGWIVHRHGVLYATEYGFDERFEALVAGVVAEFVQRFDAKRERCWIAERSGEVVGSVFLAQKSKTVCKLRLLYVEPSARGLGIGRRLVQECLAFARRVGYRRMTLWTNSVLASARRLYEAEGFTLVATDKHRMFGPELTGEKWELSL